MFLLARSTLTALLEIPRSSRYRPVQQEDGWVRTLNGKGQTLVELGAGPDGGFVTTIEILPLLTICVWYQLGN